ncbi:hypothetical protein B0E49_00260 [Polaromonas sp. C04]|nr:hypothetical protein B0E49_00260 [Polaromonas sp. C04]
MLSRRRTIILSNFVWKPIGAEAVVVDVLEDSYRLAFVLDRQATFFEQLDLLRHLEGRFAELHEISTAPFRRAQKETRRGALRREAWRVLLLWSL